jgi:aspartyl-tRNA(Asn)/glutamyl-tRNA(Gln) amidotransferase subunit A
VDPSGIPVLVNPGNTTVSIIEKVERQIARIERLNPQIRAVITPMAEEARATACQVGENASDGRPQGALGGLTVSIKDNIDVAGVRSTAGSKFFFDRIANGDATVTARLRQAQAALIAKVNLHEFAFGGTTQNPHHGSCRNPWNTDHIPGGSSGGSGASVAAGMCDVSLGTDTGGSIRIPASLNGLVGVRPTVGRVSNAGAVPVSPMFDTISPLAHTVAEAAAVFEAIAGYDPEDEFSVNIGVESWISRRAQGVDGLVMGIPANFFFDGIDPEVDAAVRKAIEILRDLGIRAVDVEIPGVEAVHKQMTDVLLCDAASFHRDRLENHAADFGTDVYERMMIGHRTSGIDHAAGMRAQERWRRQVELMLEEVDFLVMPTVGFGAPRVADARVMIEATRGLTRLTFPWSFAQVPAFSIPCGFTSTGMPVGMQIVGRHFDEALLFTVGDAYQGVTEHHLKRPAIWQEADADRE